MPDVMDKLSAEVECHLDLLHKVLAGIGEWELLPRFRFLERADWYKMTPQQREAHMKVVMGVKLTEDRSMLKPISTMPLLSMGNDIIPNISLYSLKKIWQEAQEIVGSPAYIEPVAGSSCPLARQCLMPNSPVSL